MAQSGFDGSRSLSGPVAVGLAGDRICWVSHPDEVGCGPFAVSSKAVVQDFKSAYLMPGFHDAHLHFFHSALYGSPLASMFVGTSEADCVARMQDLAATRPRGSWLLAQGWREYRWDDPTPPTRHSLDAAFPEIPVALYSGDAHTLWLNGCALSVLGISEDATPPSGGIYDRDGDGRLTGIVRETAAMELMPKIMDAFTTSELLDAYDRFQKRLNAAGVTSVSDMALSATSGLDFVRDDLYCALEDAGALTVRAHLFPALTQDMGRVRSMRARLLGERVRVSGYKQFFDGVSSQHTAWLAEPYANARTPKERGRPTVAPLEMEALIRSAFRHGERVRIHTIGDEAIHEALDIFERLADEGARTSPLILEHLENFQPADIARLARLGVIASVQPCHMALDPGGPERDLGEARVPWMWPLRQLLDAGATLAFGTDSPVTTPEPLRGIYAAVARKDATTRLPTGGWLPAERITVSEALSAYTFGSAAACGRAHELGRIEAGMLADIIVLGDDPMRAGTESIPDIPIQAAFLGGQQII